MRVKEIMVHTNVSVNPQNKISDAIQLLRQTKLYGIPVVNSQNVLIGMFTRSNLFDCLLNGIGADDQISGHYIKDVIYFVEDMNFNNLSELNQWLRNARIGQTPVVNPAGEPVGVITQAFIVNFLLDHIENIYNKECSTTEQTIEHGNDLYKINGTRYTIKSIINKSRFIEEIKRLALLAANNSSTVLIIGECGTGKELYAQAIHNASDRWTKPFVNINCAAIPAELAESELFGYEAGSFTGASKHGKPGKFELADKSTIFLDEIGDMPLFLQGKLLRAIQEKEVVRVGGLQPKKIDVRIIAATNKDLLKLSYEGKFRLDLYYRLKVLSLNIPPLRNHPEDIPLLVDYFIKKYSTQIKKQISGITNETLMLLEGHNWPGNTRELENTIQRAVIFCKGDYIKLEDLGMEHDNESPCKIYSLSGIEKEAIFKALEITKGNKQRAAKLLGISRSTLYKKLMD
ncbi:sigma-54-dependent Fis family transcriptional regulator [Desulfocucumis palustris]|nr:sigma-54-dependent Fis family transcriptional regulator [Desulfocucumis palustris]